MVKISFVNWSFELTINVFICGLFSCFFSSVVTTTSPACHVKINWQTNWYPPFFQTTHGEVCLLADPYLTMFFQCFVWFLEVFSAANNVSACRWKTYPKWLNSVTEPQRYNNVDLDMWPREQQQTSSWEKKTWPRDLTALFNLLARAVEKRDFQDTHGRCTKIQGGNKSRIRIFTCFCTVRVKGL